MRSLEHPDPSGSDGDSNRSELEHVSIEAAKTTIAQALFRLPDIAEILLNLRQRVQAQELPDLSSVGEQATFIALCDSLKSRLESALQKNPQITEKATQEIIEAVHQKFGSRRGSSSHHRYIHTVFPLLARELDRVMMAHQREVSFSESSFLVWLVENYGDFATGDPEKISTISLPPGVSAEEFAVACLELDWQHLLADLDTSTLPDVLDPYDPNSRANMSPWWRITLRYILEGKINLPPSPPHISPPPPTPRPSKKRRRKR